MQTNLLATNSIMLRIHNRQEAERLCPSDPVLRRGNSGSSLHGIDRMSRSVTLQGWSFRFVRHESPWDLDPLHDRFFILLRPTIGRYLPNGGPVEALGQVVLKPRKTRPFLARHPWVLDSAVKSVAGEPADGDVVDVLSNEGWVHRPRDPQPAQPCAGAVVLVGPE